MSYIGDNNKAFMRIKRIIINLFTLLAICWMITAPTTASAQTLAIRSAVVEPGDTVTIPIEISEDMVGVHGYQFDLTVTPSSGAPQVTITRVAKGPAATIATTMETNPLLPTSGPILIGLFTEFPPTGSSIPDFDGPGPVAAIDFAIPLSAAAGQSYDLGLSNVIFAGPDGKAVPLMVLGGTLTVGSASILADTIAAPVSLTVDEGSSLPLTATVTCGGQPIPGVTLQILIDNPEIATFSDTTVKTGSDGKATVDVTGLRGGSAAIGISAPGLGEIITAVTVNGQSPYITSTPALEIAEESTYTYTVAATDPNNDPLTYSLTVSPAGMTVDSASGEISWPVPFDQPQTGNDVTVIVSDPSSFSAAQSFSIYVTRDRDNDGHDDRLDCDDGDPLVNPGKAEIPYDGMDNDCNSATPDDDLDDDGYPMASDCDDTNPSANPGAVEIIYNGVDDDCDPATLDYVDSDGDGFFTQQAPAYPQPADCDDNNPHINPGLPETVWNGLDDDCDPTTADTWYKAYVAAIDDIGTIYCGSSNGDGTFSDYRFVHDIGNYNARGITIADFDGDGHLDIVAGGGVGGRVDYFLLLNDGTDHFSNMGIAVRRSVSGSWAMDMAAGDINTDGFMDFVGGADSGQVVIALGDGKGGFSSSVIDLGARSRGCDLADFDADGDLDLVRARYNSGAVYVFLGNGDGSFAAGTLIADVGVDPYGVVAEDFDNDGVADIIANEGGSGDSTFFKGNGDGTFTSIGYVVSLDANNHGSFDGYDFDNDGNVDVIVSDYSGRNIWCYPGNGDGTFGTRVRINTSVTRGYALAVTAPPYRLFGMPYVVIRPPEQTIPAGATADFDGSDSNDNDDGTLVGWEWDFGDGITATGDTASHAYDEEEIHGVTLKVTDNDGISAVGAAWVNVHGDPPVANAGGPYVFGEAFAANGVYTVTLDGSASTDDFGIVTYEWDFGDGWLDNFEDGDPQGWSSVSGSWEVEGGAFRQTDTSLGRAIVLADDVVTTDYTVEADLRLMGGSGQEAMLIFRSQDPNNRYEFILRGRGYNDILLYRVINGSGSALVEYDLPFTVAFDTVYHLKAEVKGSAIRLYLDGSRVIDTKDTTFTYGRVGFATYRTHARFDNFVFTSTGAGMSPVHSYMQGDYAATLTVTDRVGQQSRDNVVIQVVANNPPAADPGGPYTATESDAAGGLWPIYFDGSKSSDDFGILKYEWDFDASDGIQLDSAEMSPAHLYRAAGSYMVTLTVTDHALQTNTAQTTVTIDLSGNGSPTADPNGPYDVDEGAAQGGAWTVAFDGSNSTDPEGIAEYKWDFGDGSKLTLWGNQKLNFIETGTRLYGYDVPDANLHVIATQDVTAVKIVNLATGAVTNAATLNKYQMWSNVGPGDGVYFKVAADKPVLAYESDLSWAHSTFVPSLREGPVGHEFIFYLFNGNGFYVFAVEDTLVRAYHTNGTMAAERAMAAGSYWMPGLNNGIYHFTSTGRIALQVMGGNAYTAVPSSNGTGVGRTFYCATYNWGGGSFAIFAYEGADVSVYDMDSGALLWTQAMAKGDHWWKNGVGTRRLRVESTGDIEVWAGDNEGSGGIIHLGDDISFAGGKDGKEFYLHGLMDGAVIFAPFDDTVVSVDGQEQILNTDGYLRVSGGIRHHILSTRPVLIQTLGRANIYNDLGTYLGGVCEVTEVTHSYGAQGSYTATLTVYDHAGQQDSASTTVSVAASAPPVANAGGPYTFDEESASFGVWTATLDGTGSSDDNGIFEYTWDLGAEQIDDFEDGVVDVDRWASAGASESGGRLVVSSAYDWYGRGYYSTESFPRTDGLAFTGQVFDPTTSGNRHMMWGVFRKNPSSFHFSQMHHAIYFDNGTLRIYEDGSNRGTVGSFQRGVLYDVKIVVKSEGADYFIREAGTTDWTQLTSYSSLNRSASPLRFGASVHSHQWEFDIPTINPRIVTGQIIRHQFSEPGVRQITLTVYDDALQADSDTTTLTIAAGDPPVAHAGGDRAAEVGSLVRFNATGSSDDTAIQQYHWVFGDTTGGPGNADLPFTGKGATPQHFYDQVGTYSVALTVTDNSGQSDTDSATVAVVVGDPPVADAGGPYQGGAFGPPVYFDGRGSSDDFGIVEYRWDFDADVDSDGDGNFTNDIEAVAARPFHVFAGTGTLLEETFTGATLDNSAWLSSGATQNDVISITGTGQWTNRYLFSQQNFPRGTVSYRGRIRPVNTSGNQYAMWGLKNSGTNYHHNQMPHAIYFRLGGLRIYEGGNNRGDFGSYTRGSWYEVRIDVKKGSGATYYYRELGAADWTRLYDSTFAATSPLKLGVTISSGTFEFDDFIALGRDAHVVTLTVEDGAGQTATDTTMVTAPTNLPPHVVTVPWVAHDPIAPHETYNGRQIHLKGIVRDADPVSFQWDFGDGTQSAVLDVTNNYDLSVTHTYPDAPAGTPFVAVLRVWDTAGQMGQDTYNVVVKNRNLTTEINIAIDEGLWYLHRRQARTTTEGYPSGWWKTYPHGDYYASATSSAIQSFEINGHFEHGDHRNNPYVETVDRGLKYLFSRLRPQSIGRQTYGEPDTNGNTLGVYVSSHRSIYEGGGR